MDLRRGEVRSLRARAAPTARSGVTYCGIPDWLTPERRSYSAASASASARAGARAGSTMSVTRSPAVTARAITEISSAACRPTIEPPSTTPGRRVADDLHEPARVVVDERLRRRRERHLRRAHLAAGGERVGLGQPDVGDLGLGEDRRGRLVVVEVAVLACAGPSRARRSCVPAWRRPTTAAASPTRRRGVHVRHVRLAVVVDRDVAARRQHAGGVEAEPFGVRDRPDGEQRVGACGVPAVVALHDDAITRRLLDRHGPRAFQQPYAAPQELVLERGRHLSVLRRAAPVGGSR